MRHAVLVLGILGTLSAAFLGLHWLSDAREARHMIESAQRAGIDTSEVSRAITASYILIAASVAGVAGSVLAFNRKRSLGAGTLIIAAVAPAVLVPKALIFTFFLLLAGLVALGVKPKPTPAPTPA